MTKEQLDAEIDAYHTQVSLLCMEEISCLWLFLRSLASFLLSIEFRLIFLSVEVIAIFFSLVIHSGL